MNEQKLIDTARALVAGDKGLLAMDESKPNCNKRFARLGILQTDEARRAYRATAFLQGVALRPVRSRLPGLSGNRLWIFGKVKSPTY